MNRMNPHANHGLDLTDYGPEPFVVNIDRASKQNPNYRAALWTGTHLQLTLMSIPPGCDIGLEQHTDTDQFIRIEDGFGLVKMGKSKDKLNYQKDVCGGFTVFVPVGTWHNIINTGNRPIKLYTIYAPPHHPHGTVQPVKPETETDEPEEYIDYTEPAVCAEPVRHDDCNVCDECKDYAEPQACGECIECEPCDDCTDCCDCMED